MCMNKYCMYVCVYALCGIYMCTYIYMWYIMYTLEAGCVELDDGSKFELVEKFCYLGDMLCAGGGSRGSF